jgi:hypothetical protein
MAIKKFNAVSGISVGDNVIFEVIDDTANITANNLTVTATTALGDLANVKIDGGSTGYVIRTDGLGNLSWENPADVGVVGNNTEIQFNDSGLFGAVPEFTFDKTSNTLTVAGTVSSTLLTGTITSSSQPNITSVGVLNSLSVTGNIAPGNLSTSGTVTANLFVGTFQGNISGNLTVPGSNTQVIYNANGNAGASSGFTFNSATNAISVAGNATLGNVLTIGLVSATGNVTGNYVLGNGSQLTGITTNYSNANVANYLPTFSGNLTAGNISATGNLYAAGLVSTGGTGSISGTGNIIGGNLLTSGIVSATGNVTGNYILGNGSQLTGITTSYGNANVANYLPTFSGNLTAGNISATGNVAGANLISTGNVSFGNFTMYQSGSKLYFAYNGTAVFSFDSTGTMTAANNVTAAGTP